MNYTLNNAGFVKDGSGNYTGVILYYSGTDSTTGDNVNGSVHITLDQFTATAGQVSAIVALIGPAVQALVGSTAG
ncbi:hypothetical protein [Sporolactobacillus pectinivorans]|uniref:hypothetical protein n=1 Tax=Sporolactobacillus pectinivorans TaxID=1591408 RepID=UPI000C257D75|nr:hypothetical protein [Sporolactobacillus pectinivorans]